MSRLHEALNHKKRSKHVCDIYVKNPNPTFPSVFSLGSLVLVISLSTPGISCLCGNTHLSSKLLTLRVMKPASLVSLKILMAPSCALLQLMRPCGSGVSSHLPPRRVQKLSLPKRIQLSRRSAEQMQVHVHGSCLEFFSTLNLNWSWGDPECMRISLCAWT